MKILHFTDSICSGGKERQLVELLKGLSVYDQIKSEIVTMSYDIHYSEIQQLDIKIHYLIRKSRKDISTIYRLYKLCQVVQPDLIHTWGSFPSIFTAPIAKIRGIKFINGTIRKAPKRLMLFGEDWLRSKITFPLSDKIVANSLAGLKSYRAPFNKSVYIHNGFDFKRIKKLDSPNTIRQRFGISTNKVVGMVATFSDNKDYNTFLLSAISILKKREDVTFIAVGDGPNFEDYKRSINPYFQDKIRLLGKQDGVESIINLFNIGILASYTEGLSNSIMEYMALGKPVVASKNEGNQELILNKKTGFLVEQKDVGAMVSAITTLLDNKNLCNQMGNLAKERIQKCFSSQKMVSSYVELYKEVMAK